MIACSSGWDGDVHADKCRVSNATAWPTDNPDRQEVLRGQEYHRQEYDREEMWEIVVGAIGLIGLVIGVVWLIGLPGEDDEDELAGFVTVNWDDVKSGVDNL